MIAAAYPEGCGSGSRRASGPPPGPARLASAALPPNNSGTSGPHPPLPARLAARPLRGRPGPRAVRASPAATRHRRLRRLARPIGAGALRLASGGQPPGAACGPPLASRLPPLPLRGRSGCGGNRLAVLGPPCGALRLALRAGLGPLRASPAPVCAAAGSPQAAPACGPGSSPCGARPGLVAPRGRCGPAGRLNRPRPRGLGLGLRRLRAALGVARLRPR